MGVSNASQEVTQCSSVSAVNNRRSVAERNFGDMFISKRLFISPPYIHGVTHFQRSTVYSLASGLRHPSRRGALLTGKPTRISKGRLWQIVASGIHRFYTLSLFYLSQGLLQGLLNLYREGSLPTLQLLFSVPYTGTVCQLASSSGLWCWPTRQRKERKRLLAHFEDFVGAHH